MHYEYIAVTVQSDKCCVSVFQLKAKLLCRTSEVIISEPLSVPITACSSASQALLSAKPSLLFYCSYKGITSVARTSKNISNEVSKYFSPSGAIANEAAKLFSRNLRNIFNPWSSKYFACWNVKSQFDSAMLDRSSTIPQVLPEKMTWSGHKKHKIRQFHIKMFPNSHICLCIIFILTLTANFRCSLYEMKIKCLKFVLNIKIRGRNSKKNFVLTAA